MSDSTPKLPADYEPCLNLKIRQASRVMTQHYERRLAKHQLKIGQFAILRALYNLRESNHKALQSMLVMDQTTMTRALKPLIRDGLIRSEPSEHDRRAMSLRLSQEGVVRYEQAAVSWAEAQASLKQQVGDSVCEALIVVTDALIGMKS